MPQIGVRELKVRASEILRNVRRRRTRYVITYRGHPMGMLTPIDEPETSAAASTAQDNWDELTRLGQKIAEGWPAGVNSVDVLAEMRR
jgi:prevent-host-death family protein